MFSSLAFPKSPPLIAEWCPIFLEPIVNSGERIAILIVIRTPDGKKSIHRALDEKIIKILYGENFYQINGLIDYIEKALNTSGDLTLPFDGIHVMDWSKATDFSIEGILNQALTQTSSLSAFGDLLGNNKKNPTKDSSWNSEVKLLVTNSNPNLLKCFNRDVFISHDISYSYDFYYESFVANLLDFKSLNKQKAQTSIFKMQLLSHNNLIKEKQLILQIPTVFDFSEMTYQKKSKIEEQINIFSNLLHKNDVEVIPVKSSHEASERILDIAA